MAAYGNQGRILIPKLRSAGFKVRAFRASSGRDDELLELGATEVISGDAADRSVLQKALAGVDTVYHVGPTVNPFERDMGFAMVDAVRSAGGIHLIYSSVLHAVLSKLVQHKIKRDVEEYLIEAGVNYTILQPSDYMRPGMLDSAFSTGTLNVPFYMTRRQAMIDLHDLADVVVKISRERDKHYFATYELTSADSPSGRDMAEAASKVAGRPMKIGNSTADEAFDRVFGLGRRDAFKHQYGVILSVDIWYKQFDFLGNSNMLEWLLGRPPTSFQEFAGNEWSKYKTRTSSPNRAQGVAAT